MDHETNILAEPIAALKGVGPKSAEALAKAGLLSVYDLLLRVPKSVVQELSCPGFAFMEAGRTYVAKGKVRARKITGMGAKKRLEAIIEDDSGRMSAVFFGPAVNYALLKLEEGREVVLIGEAKSFIGRMQMVHPKLLDEAPVQESQESKYAQIAGLAPRIIKSVAQKALAKISKQGVVDHAPQGLLQEHKLSPLGHALEAIHTPTNTKSANWDKRAEDPHFARLAFEEILSFYVRLFLERQAALMPLGQALEEPKSLGELSQILPFTLTHAQERVVSEILADMSKSFAMSRLLQGDVGSGKTAVSALAALHVARAHYQVAVMAPTEILAEQLFSVYTNFFKHENIQIALITSSTKNKERKNLADRIAQGLVTIVVGTHAVLSADINFKNLALVIIDEQHRFGVKQRAALLAHYGQKQGFTPHLLVMSATPIPRSLALTLYGDLDLSVIDERPAGRLPVSTKILSGPPLESLVRLGERIIESKQKAFVVFPLVEESEHVDLENATKAKALLAERFGEHSCLLLHGKMSADEKRSVMEIFSRNMVPFLVSTTVVEVGVDVPDATCMAIVHPERFGLAQLHQLRGRVGRGQAQSFCFLLTDIKNRFGTAYKRLHALCTTESGFELAQVDLDLRGPGDLLGTKQAGLPSFHIFNHADFGRLVSIAKNHAKLISQKPLEISACHLISPRPTHFS